MSMIIKLLTTALLIYGLIISLVFLLQERLIFYPQAMDGGDRERFQPYQVSFIHEGNKIQGWYVPGPSSKPLIIYYGGNAEEISWNIPNFQRYLDASFLLLNYRGYGDSSGTPSEAVLKADALAAFDHFSTVYATTPSQIILFGRSLGSGVAVYVASQRTVAGVVLVTPFDSMTAVASHHYPLLPVRWLLRHRFEAATLAHQINRPLLSLLADRDRVVPAEHGLQLEKSWQGEVISQRFATADHLTIADKKEYWPTIANFIGKRGHPEKTKN